MVQKKYEKGITLIALVVTLIVVLIIAGVSISALTGQEGSITSGEKIKTETNVKEEKSALRLAVQETMTADSKGKIEETPLKDHLDQHIGNENYKNFEYREASSSFIVQIVKTENWYTITKEGDVLDGKVSIQGITLDKEASMFWEETIQLEATIKTDEEDIPLTDARWKSSDKSIAKVDEDGLVTAQRKSGIVTISVEKNGLTAKCVIDVSNPVRTVELNPAEITIDLSVDPKYQAIGKYYPEDADRGTKLSYTISDTSVAQVDENGLITGIKNGETELTLESENGITSVAKVKVVTSPTAVKLNKPSNIIEDSFQLEATIIPDTANVDTELTWTSSNKNVATVDNNGLVRRVSNGDTTITVSTANGKTAEC